MLKLLIVFLFILKIKTENENNFEKGVKAKGKLFDVKYNGRTHSSIVKNKRLYLANPVTRSLLRGSFGPRKEIEREEVLEDNMNKDFSEFTKKSVKLANPLSRGLLKQPTREKIVRVNGLNDHNLQEKEVVPTLPCKSKLLQLISTTNSLKNSNPNVLIDSPDRDQIGNSNYDSLVDRYIPSTAETVNEVPYNVLKIVLDDGSGEEHRNNYYDDIEISKYKSDSRIETRNECLTKSTESTNKGKTPMGSVDGDQNECSVSLLLSLINLNTLKPKTRYYFTENKIIKKVMTQNPHKCPTKTCTKKPTTGNHSCSDKKSSTIPCLAKSKKKQKACSTEIRCSIQRHTCKHTACATESTCSTQRHTCKHLTPVITVAPWPELTVSRNLVFNSSIVLESILSNSSNLASKVNSNRTSFSGISNGTYSSQPLPNINDNYNLKNVQTTCREVHLSQSVSSFVSSSQNTPGMERQHSLQEVAPYSFISDNKVNLNARGNSWLLVPNITYEPAVSVVSTAQSSLQSGTESLPYPKGSAHTTFISDNKAKVKESGNSWPTLPLVSSRPGGEVKTSSTERSDAVRPGANFDKTQINETSGSLLTTLVNLSRGSSATPFKSSVVYPTRDYNVSVPVPSFNQTNLTEISNARLTDPNKMLPLKAEVNVDSSKEFNHERTNGETCLNISQTDTSSQSTTKVCDIPFPEKHSEIYESSTIQSTNEETYFSPTVPKEKIRLTGMNERSCPPKTPIGVQGNYAISGTASVDEYTSSLPLNPMENTYTPKVKTSNSLDETDLPDYLHLSFSPPPPEVFSHEPEFIATLFNDANSGVSTEFCAVERGITLSTMDKTELSDQHLEQPVVTSNVNQAGKGNEASRGSIQTVCPTELYSKHSEQKAAASSAETNQSITVSSCKSTTYCNATGEFPQTVTQNTELPLQQPSHLDQQFVSPRPTVTDTANQAVKGNEASYITIEIVIPTNSDSKQPEQKTAACSTESNQSILLSHFKSTSFCDNSGGRQLTPISGSFNAYFTQSAQNMSKCLADFSKLFSELATKKCK